MPNTVKFESLKDLFSELVAEMEKKAPYAACLGIRRRGVRVQASTTQTQILPEASTAGVVLSCWDGRRFHEHSTNLLDRDGLAKAARALAAQAGEAMSGSGLAMDPGPALDQHFATALSKDPSAAKLGAKLEVAQALRDALQQADPRVRNAVAVVSDLASDEVFVNRARRLSQRLVRTEEMMQVYVAAGGRSQMLWDGRSLAQGMESLGWCQPRAAGLVADACRLLGAPRLAPGMRDIVTDPSWSGMLAHEAFGHGTEADMFTKDRARGAQYLGKPVASQGTVLYDDPSLPGQSGSCFFDHEGVGASPTRIIEDGLLVRAMTDRSSAAVLGLPASANGRRESWERKAYARMTNTYFAPGPHKPAELIAAVDEGIYLRYASNGMEDPQGWGIQCEGLWAERIAQGRLTGELFSPVIFTGYVPDILASIRMAADDLHISGLGHCGKGHKEWVKNTLGGPHLLLRARLA